MIQYNENPKKVRGEDCMNFYLLFFLLIIIVGLVVSYIYFMKDKSDQLRAIQEGICPKCHQESMELVDQRSTGCSGPKMIVVTMYQLFILMHKVVVVEESVGFKKYFTKIKTPTKVCGSKILQIKRVS